LEVIDQIYDSFADDAAYARLPEALAKATGARSAIVLEFDPGLRPYKFVRYGICDDQHARFLSQGLAEHDVWTQAIARTGRYDEAVLCEDFIDADSFRRTTFYNELYRPFGDDTARCMGVVMRRPDGFMSVGLHRAYGQPRFEARDAAVLSSLLPHLQRLSAVRARLGRSESGTAMLGAALEEISGGLLITDDLGRLRHANGRALDLLDARNGLALSSGRVLPTDPQLAERFARALQTAASRTGACGDAIRLQRQGQIPVRLLIAPLVGDSRNALILIDAPEEGDGDIARDLASLYGLSASEAELAVLLHDGLTPSEAAEARGVRLSTIRSQILSILHKTEARGLGDLLRILGGLPRLERR